MTEPGKLHLDKNGFTGRTGPLLLVVLDGVGIGPPGEQNAFDQANTPNLDRLLDSKLRCELAAKGPAVGLPSEGDMGNSEVGHNAMGAGRIFDQGAKLVNKAIADGVIFETDLWKEIVTRGKAGRTVHFIGLLSDGNVHSHLNHLYALIDHCAEAGVGRVRIHALLDGRDVGERSALQYLEPTEALLEKYTSEKGLDYRIASGGGRMRVTMDRYEADWEIVERGWKAHVLGDARPFPAASAAVRTFYEENPKATDQYLGAFVVVDDEGQPIGRIEDGDAVVFFNFRGDRAIELSRAFEEADFDAFDRVRVPDVLFCGMLEYDGDLHVPKRFLVPPPKIDRTVSEYLCAAGVRSFAVSETQKYGHVTYFWNGNRSGYIDRELETYIEIPSDKIEFDQAPAMKAREITDKVIELLEEGTYQFGRLNLANGDMVGHTGKLPAAIEAMAVVDECVGRLLEVIEQKHGILILTADHGNVEEMFEMKDGKREVKTSHSLNPVPFAIYDPDYAGEYRMADVDSPGIGNIASTLLALLGFAPPTGYCTPLVSFQGD